MLVFLLKQFFFSCTCETSYVEQRVYLFSITCGPASRNVPDPSRLRARRWLAGAFYVLSPPRCSERDALESVRKAAITLFRSPWDACPGREYEFSRLRNVFFRKRALDA